MMTNVNIETLRNVATRKYILKEAGSMLPFRASYFSTFSESVESKRASRNVAYLEHIDSVAKCNTSTIY